MLKNFFKIGYRSLLKRKGYTLINVLGLATGMAVCLLIVLYIRSELNYDNFLEKGNNIYRVVLDRKYPGRSTSYALVPLSIGEAIQHENPEVIQSTRLFNFTGNGSLFVKIGEKLFEEKRVLGADSNFFQVFAAKMMEGDPKTALQKANSVVINETTAKKYFGSAENAIGKSFQSDLPNHFIITGVCRDWPENSHFEFDMLIANATFINPNQHDYIGFSSYTYLLLNPHSSPERLESKFPHIIEKYVSGDIGRNFGVSFQQFQAAGNGYHYYLQPLAKIHLYSNLQEGELRTNGSINSVYIFSIIAIFILVIACINFINLSTARSVERAKEVGIRKTFGSDKKSLVWQFLFESVLVSFMSILLAILLMALLLPEFNHISGKELSLGFFIELPHFLLLILFSILVGLVAGLYPAFVLTSFEPILVLKGKFKSNKYGMALRNILVVFQFAISVVLIICTIIVSRQMQFMLSDKLGFKKDHVIEIERTDLLAKQTRAFKNELAQLAGVESVSTASTFPGREGFAGITFQAVGSKEPMTGKALIVGDQFGSLLGLQMKEGRFFSKEFSTDSLSVVLNEKAVEELGLKKALGARLTCTDANFNKPDGSAYVYTVIGVIKDFHFQSLHQKISPLVIANSGRFGDELGFTGVRISAADFQTSLESIEKIWKKFVPGRPFHYSFLDRSLAGQYQSEERTERIFTIFSLFAIFIACIGLFGLAAYATQLRLREISIRKVLGANAINIVNMLSIDFLKLIILSSLIAFPLAWWGMYSWLQHFAYRTELSWWIFLASALIAALIALFTISLQAAKAAFMNPVKNLRTE